MKKLLLLSILLFVFQTSFSQITFERIIGDTNYDDGGYCVALASDHGYIVSGYTFNKAWLVKTDSTGALSWTKTQTMNTGERARSVEQTTDGGYIMAGDAGSFPVKTFVVKTNSTGD